MALQNYTAICQGYIAIPKSFLSSLANIHKLKPGHSAGGGAPLRPAKVRKA